MRAANKQTGEGAGEGQRGRGAARKARRMMANQADAMPVVEAADGGREVRVVDAELVEPAPRGGLLEVFQQPYLLKLIVSRQLAQMYAASLLGLLWSYVQPALRFAVYYVVIGFVFNLHKETPYFAIHLFTGIVVVHYFGETWGGGTRSIWQNKALVKKMRMPREMFPVASMLVAAYHTLPQLVVLVLACVITGWSVSWVAVGAGALGSAILITFALAMALIFSALNVFFRDFQNIVATVMQFMHFLVPMIYPFSRIYNLSEGHPILYEIYNANPIAQAVMLLQRLFWYPLMDESQQQSEVHFPPDMYERGFITLALCVVLLWLAQRFFSRMENKFPERL